MSSIPPYDPEANNIVHKDKKFQKLAITIVATSILLVVVFPTVSGITGRAGQPKVEIEKVRERKLLGCVDLTGWTDS